MNLSPLRLVCISALLAITFGACRNEANRIPETCFDGRQNQGETAVDCGGPNCPECDPTCDDGLTNQDEFSPVSLTNPNVVGIDCGGENCAPCATCDDGIQNAHWVLDLNLSESDINRDSVGRGPGGFLYRLIMERGVDCGFPCDSVCPPTCNDGILNGNETGIDCGGPDCGACPQPPNCFDGIQNGLETGIDCGSPECPLSRQSCPDPTCDDGIRNVHIELTDVVQEGYIVVIETGIDCDNNPSTACPDCPLPTCFDGIKNGTETGIDCGGNCITECSEVPSCHDQVQNGTETGVDCGGDCPPCPHCDDTFKNGPELLIDCLDYPIPSYTASDGSPCVLCPSCHDGILTEPLLEYAIDCGGPNCEPCDQFMIAAGIGVTAATGTFFLDQNTLNEQQVAIGNFDTLFVPDALVLNLQQGAAPGSQYASLVGVQQQVVQNIGTYERRVEIRMPKPNNILEGGANAIGLIPHTPQPPGNPVLVSVVLREGWLDGEFEGMRTFFSVVPIPAQGDPITFEMVTDYNYSNIAGGLIQGGISYVRLREQNTIPGVIPEERVITGLEFSIQYGP